MRTEDVEDIMGYIQKSNPVFAVWGESWNEGGTSGWQHPRYFSTDLKEVS